MTLPPFLMVPHTAGAERTGGTAADALPFVVSIDPKAVVVSRQIGIGAFKRVSQATVSACAAPHCTAPHCTALRYALLHLRTRLAARV